MAATQQTQYMEGAAKVAATVDEIMALYEQYGHADYIGEPVSQVQHMCQCAQLAEAEGGDDEVVLASFLHDIGHLCAYAHPEMEVQHMDAFGVADHEMLGAAFLKSRGFSGKIVSLVASHVAAKRYLTFKFPDYYALLSEASKQTLVMQGGPMTAAEAAVFENDPLADQYVALRRRDEQAKSTDKPLPDLTQYRLLITEHLALQEL